MASSTTKRLQQPADKVVLWIVAALAAVGIVAVYSAISFLAETKAGGDTELLLFRHLARLGIALVALYVFSRINYRYVAKISRIALIGSLVLLVLVKVFGVTSGGAARWLQIGTFGFQPSDLARVSLLVYVATLLAGKQDYIKRFSSGFAPILFWMMLTSPGRAARVESYLGVKLFPNTDQSVFSARGEGYQADQARIAFAMGGLTGVGPGKSVQRDFLPAPYNDFIFAIIAEEYGMVGALVLLALLVWLLFQGFLRIARYAADPLGLFLAVGLTLSLVLYGFVHAGVASGLLPVTGLPMPFVSYGGTSLAVNGVMVGILLNISRGVE